MSSEGQFESRYVAVLDDTLKNALSEARRLYDSMVEELQAEMCLVKKENVALRSKYNRLKKQRRVDTASQCDPEQQERRLSLVPEEQDLLQRPSEDDENGETVPLATSTNNMKTLAGLEDCGASQTSSDGQIVDRHRRSMRKTIPTAKSAVHPGEKPFTCAVCGKGCHRMSDLKKHMCTHTADKPFICTVCGEGFRQEVGLNVHKSIHAGLLKCEVCGQGFNQQRFLKAHMRMHTGEELLICTVCDKPFTEKRYLTNHMRTHKGERHFTCAVCGKGFRQNAVLKKHMLVHAVQKPYTCKACNKCFTQKVHLVMHIRLHTGEKPYCCTVCSKRFYSNIKLKRHMESHTGDDILKKPMALSLAGQEPCINDMLSMITFDHSYAAEFPL